jgi:clan AA aspartic protease
MQVDGYFNARDEPVIRLGVGSLSIEVLVDTGFDGSLLIPSHIANQLDLTFEGSEGFQSVTGEPFLADAYSIEIDWLGTRITVPLATCREVGEAILGGHMLKNCQLTIDYGNRTVIITESREANQFR